MQLTRFALSGGRGLFYISAWILLTESRQGRHRCSRQEMRIPSAVRRGIVGDSGVRRLGSSTFIIGKGTQAGGRSAATHRYWGLAALVPPGKGKTIFVRRHAHDDVASGRWT